MRRFILLALLVLIVGGFAAQNWAEITRSSQLWFGPVATQAPLGLVLLTLLGLGLIAYLISTTAVRTRALMESREHHKTLEAQRELADKAEASRFTDLRTHLDTSQRELRAELAQMNRSVMSRLSEVENRLDSRLRNSSTASPASSSSSWSQPNKATVVRHDEPHTERAMAMPAESVHGDLERARADVRAEQVRGEGRVEHGGVIHEDSLRDEHGRDRDLTPGRNDPEDRKKASGLFRNWR